MTSTPTPRPSLTRRNRVVCLEHPPRIHGGPRCRRRTSLPSPPQTTRIMSTATSLTTFTPRAPVRTSRGQGILSTPARGSPNPTHTSTIPSTSPAGRHPRPLPQERYRTTMGRDDRAVVAPRRIRRMGMTRTDCRVFLRRRWARVGSRGRDREGGIGIRRRGAEREGQVGVLERLQLKRCRGRGGSSGHAKRLSRAAGNV